MNNASGKWSVELAETCKLVNSECRPTSTYSKGKSHHICLSMIPASLAPTLCHGQAGVDHPVPFYGVHFSPEEL